MSTNVRSHNQTNNIKKSGSSVLCRKCKSDQIVANKKGYSFGLMFKVWLAMVGIGVGIPVVLGILSTVLGLDNFLLSMGIVSIVVITLVLSLPISLFSGAVGRNDIVNGCMNCGNKWVAGKN